MDKNRLEELREETAQYRAVADDRCMSTQYEDDILALIDAEIDSQSATDEAVQRAIAMNEEELKAMTVCYEARKSVYEKYKDDIYPNADGVKKDMEWYESRINKCRMSITALRQYQKPTDEAVQRAIEWQEAEKESAQNDWERAGAEWRMEPGAQAQHDERMASFDLAIQAMRQMEIDLYPKAGLDHDADDWGNGYSRGYADGLQARQMKPSK